MSIALQLYIQLIAAKDDKTRARAIAEAFDALETRLTQLTAQTTSPGEHEPGARGAGKDDERQLQGKPESRATQVHRIHPARAMSTIRTSAQQCTALPLRGSGFSRDSALHRCIAAEAAPTNQQSIAPGHGGTKPPTARTRAWLALAASTG
jgi:hypothetical protein